jgi:hypothetical protein
MQMDGLEKSLVVVAWAIEGNTHIAGCLDLNLCE